MFFSILKNEWLVNNHRLVHVWRTNLFKNLFKDLFKVMFITSNVVTSNGIFFYYGHDVGMKYSYGVERICHFVEYSHDMARIFIGIFHLAHVFMLAYSLFTLTCLCHNYVTLDTPYLHIFCKVRACEFCVG
jgi:hypothetical protein